MVVPAPRFFAKEIQLGGLMRIASAFAQVQSALSFLVDSFYLIAEWNAVVQRLTGFSQGLADVDTAAQKSKVKREETDSEEIVLDQLTIALPGEKRLFENINLVFPPKKSVLITGPTGSGKTTTLYAALGLRNSAAEKIITLEDPVEYQLAGVTQVPLHRSAGVTFGAALRSVLRQDPDVIMVGEMRDPETAELAVQAASTGHLVISTLHTNDAVGALPRLLDLRIPDYLAAATVDGILAQRLVRRICDGCREVYDPPREAVRTLAGDAPRPAFFQRGAGCQACRGTGYRGRTGIYELLVVDDAVREAIVRRASRPELRELALRAGMRSLRADAWERVRDGITTVEEVLRVVQD